MDIYIQYISYGEYLILGYIHTVYIIQGRFNTWIYTYSIYNTGKDLILGYIHTVSILPGRFNTWIYTYSIYNTGKI